MFPLFHYGSMSIEEARLQAGFFVHECLALFGISDSTWSRWKKNGAPVWAFRLLECYAGHMDHLGWKHWRITANGKLVCNGLSSRLWWTPADLLIHAHNLSVSVIPSSNRLSSNDSVYLGVSYGPGSIASD